MRGFRSGVNHQGEAAGLNEASYHVRPTPVLRRDGLSHLRNFQIPRYGVKNFAVEFLLELPHNAPMKPSYFALLLAVFVGASSLQAQAPPAAPPASAARPAHQAPDVAAPKLGRDGQPDAGFLKRHEGF